MKKGIIKLLILFLGFCFIGSCKRRYEEGPLISLSTKCKRILRTWRLEYLYIDGKDSTNAVYESLGIVDGKFEAIFDLSSVDATCKEGGSITVYFKSSINSSPQFGNYDLSKDGKYLNLDILNTSGLSLKYRPIGPLFTGSFVKYRVKRLTKTELWLDVTYDGKYVWIHFKS